MIDGTIDQHTVAESRPLGAEVDERSAWWFLVITKPDCDGMAARWLVRRRFGIFQPIERRIVYLPKASGGHERVTVREPALPGYIFVQLWDAPRMFARVERLPGVEGFLCEFDEPVKLPDSFIRRLLALDRVEETGGHVGVTGRRQRRRRPRPGRKLIRPHEKKAAKLLARALAEAGHVDAAKRISAQLAPVGSALAVEGD
jgi:transcription antitermination factor NusG